MTKQELKEKIILLMDDYEDKNFSTKDKRQTIDLLREISSVISDLDDYINERIDNADCIDFRDKMFWD